VFRFWLAERVTTLYVLLALADNDAPRYPCPPAMKSAHATTQCHIGSAMSSNSPAWVAFLLSSALIIGTLLPIVGYGYVFLYFPVFLAFGCDSARSVGDCLRIQATPFVPIVLTICALVGCSSAIIRTRYVTSVFVAALACAASWVFILQGLS
jgi:hypothetical protein